MPAPPTGTRFMSSTFAHSTLLQYHCSETLHPTLQLFSQLYYLCILHFLHCRRVQSLRKWSACKKGSSSSKSSKTLHHSPKNKVSWPSSSAQFHCYKRPRSCGIRVLGGLCHRCITYTSPQSFHTSFYLYHLTR